MNQRPPLVSIIIPTYNRVNFLQKLLEAIMPEVLTYEGLVQICISDNCSTDTTLELVEGIKKQHPNVIKYSRQSSNVGVARNLVSVMNMSEGDFVWILGDDDMVVSSGIKKVVDFILGYANKETGLIGLGHRSFVTDSVTQKEIIYFKTVIEDKPPVYPIPYEDVIRLNFPNSAFFSVLVYNGPVLRKVLQEESALIEEGLRARDYIHTFLYQLMFLKYPELGALRLNESIIDEELHYYKFYVEDRFRLHYVAKRKLEKLLLSSVYKNEYEKITAGRERGRVKGIVIGFGQMKCFRAFNYDSFLGCLKMFLKEAPFQEALVFSFFFIIFTILPSFILKAMFKVFIKLRHRKNWQEKWFSLSVAYGKMSTGQRRQLS